MESLHAAIERFRADFTPFLTFFIDGKQAYVDHAAKQVAEVQRGIIPVTVEINSTERRRLVERFTPLIQHATTTNTLFKILYTHSDAPDTRMRLLSLHVLVDCTRFDAMACAPVEQRDVTFNRMLQLIDAFHAYLQSPWDDELGYDVSPVPTHNLVNSEYIEPSEVELPFNWPPHLPLLPTQVQSLGWMQRFERAVHGEPMLHYNMFVPLLQTSYVYTRTGGVGTLLHQDAYRALQHDDTIVHRRTLRFNGALLADRTGSGKTATMLALVASSGRREARIARGVNVLQNSWRIPLCATLIIVPLNLVTQWRQEATKFNVDRTLNVVPVINKRDYYTLTLHALKAADIVITTPDFLMGRIYPARCRSYSHDMLIAIANSIRAGHACREIVFQAFLWRRLVFDEHHENTISTHSMYHTANSASSQFTRNLQAEVHWGLSGTPHPIYFSEPLRCSLHNFSPADAPFIESRQRLLLEQTTRRSPYVNHLAPPIQNTTIVTLTQRERDMLRAYGGGRDSSWHVQLSTTFNAAAFDHQPGGAAADEVLAAMTFTQLSQHMMSRRNQEVAQRTTAITALSRTQEDHFRTLSRIRQVDNLDPTDSEFRALTDEEHAAGGSRGTTADSVVVGVIRAHNRTLQRLRSELAHLEAERDFFHTQLTMPEESKTCPICMNEVSNVITPCGHWFCKACSLQYLRTQPVVDLVKCPMCNTRSSRKRWTEMQEQMEPPQPAGFYGSKLHKIAELLRTIKRSGEKAIMFVEWSGLMRAIRAILTTAGLQVALISGNCNTRASAIQKMQSGELDVLIMSLESSTSGLNLVAANHVIFPHAFVNVPPSAVEQAIARVHRLGQTKQVYVHTFIAEGPERDIHERQPQV